MSAKRWSSSAILLIELAGRALDRDMAVTKSDGELGLLRRCDGRRQKRDDDEPDRPRGESH